MLRACSPIRESRVADRYADRITVIILSFSFVKTQDAAEVSAYGWTGRESIVYQII